MVVRFGKAAVLDMRGRETIAAYSGRMLGSCRWRLGDAVVCVEEEEDLRRHSGFGMSGIVVGCWEER